MVTYNSQENHLIITLPNKNVADLKSYYLSILGMLSTIEIQGSNPELMGRVKIVYELLSHFQLQENHPNNEERWNALTSLRLFYNFIN